MHAQSQEQIPHYARPRAGLAPARYRSRTRPFATVSESAQTVEEPASRPPTRCQVAKRPLEETPIVFPRIENTRTIESARFIPHAQIDAATCTRRNTSRRAM